jgi:hypothetical protein
MVVLIEAHSANGVNFLASIGIITHFTPVQ